MDRRNNTRTDKSQGSDHGAISPRLIIEDTDFRIVAEGAVPTPVILQPVGREPPVGLLAWITGLEPAEPPIEPPPARASCCRGADGLGFGVDASAPRAMNIRSRRTWSRRR